MNTHDEHHFTTAFDESKNGGVRNLPTHLVVGGKVDGSTSIFLQARRHLSHFSLLMNRGNFQAEFG